MRGGEAVPVTMVVSGDEPRAVGLMLHPFDTDVFLGAAPDTPAHRWLQTAGRDGVAEVLGLRAATRAEYDAFMAQHTELRIEAGEDEPMSVLDARHLRRASRGLS